MTKIVVKRSIPEIKGILKKRYTVKDKGEKAVVQMNPVISVGLKFSSQGKRTEISTYWDMPVITFVIFAVALLGGYFLFNIFVGLILGLIVAIAYEIPTRILQARLFKDIEAMVSQEEDTGQDDETARGKKRKEKVKG